MATPVALIRWALTLLMGLLWVLPARQVSEPAWRDADVEKIEATEHPDTPFIRRAKQGKAPSSGSTAIDRDLAPRLTAEIATCLCSGTLPAPPPFGPNRPLAVRAGPCSARGPPDHA